MPTKITLIGSGNVAHNLGVALLNQECEIVEVVSRTIANARILANKLNSRYTNTLANINLESDIYIVAASDNSIEKIANELELKDKLIVHTSGSVEIKVLKKASENYGSFYPLQTFTKTFQADFSQIPICIEGNNEKNLKTLFEFANCLSSKVIKLNSTQRQKLHLSAVFSANFANFMQVIAQDLCEEQEVDFELLKPLIKEVFDKNLTAKAIENQTGPALRKDSYTMNKHLELLKDRKELSELYQLVSKMIEKRGRNT